MSDAPRGTMLGS